MRILFSLPYITLFIFSVDNYQPPFTDEEHERPFRGYLLRKFKEIIPDIVQRWKNFTEEARQELTSLENRRRFFIFGKNQISIYLHNKKDVGFTLGENHLIDKARDEYFKMLSVEGGLTTIEESYDEQSKDKNVSTAMPVQIQGRANRDWRRNNVVTRVKQQGACGSCYAFTTVAVVEAARAIKYGKLEDLSEQAIVDCSGSYNNQGCSGGNIPGTLKYLKNTRLPLEKNYPYRTMKGNCRVSRDNKNPTISGFKSIPSGDENQLSNVIADQGPVAVAVDARLKSFQFYKSGIYGDPQCSSSKLNHGVAAIGTITGKNPHFIIKNSWGIGWGENGYMRLAKFKNNMCGVATSAFVPFI